MGRKQTPLRPIQIDYHCDECEHGLMRPVGHMLMTDPPQFEHKCTECGYLMVFNERYPTVRYALEGGSIDLENYTQQRM